MNAAATNPDPPLDEAVIEAAATRPPMFLGTGLPLKLASILLCAGSLLIVFIEDLLWQAGVLVGVAMIGGAVRTLVARDLHGFDIWLVHVATDGKALDRVQWGGSRAAALPLRPRTPYGIFTDAA